MSDAGVEWIKARIAQADALVEAETVEGSAGRQLALAGLAPFRGDDVQAALARAGEDRFRRLLLRLGLGDDVGLATYQALEGASFEETRAAMKAVTVGTRDKSLQRIADQDTIAKALRGAALDALKFVVPLLLAAA